MSGLAAAPAEATGPWLTRAEAEAAERALLRSALSQQYPIRVTPLAHFSVGPLSLLLEIRGRQCEPEILNRLSDLGESLILRTCLRLPRRCNGRIRKLFRRGSRHDSSPSVGADTATVGAEAAPGPDPADRPGPRAAGGDQ